MVQGGRCVTTKLLERRGRGAFVRTCSAYYSYTLRSTAFGELLVFGLRSCKCKEYWSVDVQCSLRQTPHLPNRSKKYSRKRECSMSHISSRYTAARSRLWNKAMREEFSSR